MSVDDDRGQVPMDRVTGTKDWQNSINVDFRTTLVHSMVRALFPLPDHADQDDKRMLDLINYAAQIEQNVYVCASGIGEYSELFSKRMYQMQKESMEMCMERERKIAAANRLTMLHKCVLDEIGGTNDKIRNMLATIYRDSKSNHQYSDLWKYLRDVRIWLESKRIKIPEDFGKKIDHVMQTHGYCCGRDDALDPVWKYCYNCETVNIGENATYYSYQNRYMYCRKCFKKASDTIKLGKDPKVFQILIEKSQFAEHKHKIDPEWEQLVRCVDCGRDLHAICVLYLKSNWPNGFVCDKCLNEKGDKRKVNCYSAKQLPHTNMSKYIEERVNGFLSKVTDADAGAVHIRVLSSSKKSTVVKPRMHEVCVKSQKFPAEFPYTYKTLFAFVEINGVDVCFFGMYVQEYGSDCPPPNSRHVYIAYLDSVKWFEPKQYRTAVYHEILLGYMDYVKQLGYTMAHIWACPTNGEYIFYGHPPDQKTPDKQQLRKWYTHLLMKAKDRGIVQKVMSYKQSRTDKQLKTVLEFPYFDGEAWPDVLEESIQQKNDVKMGYSFKVENLDDVLKRMAKQKGTFFVIRLQSEAEATKPIEDPDQDPIVRGSIDNAFKFWRFSKKFRCEFTSLRWAKYSTMKILFALHKNENMNCIEYACNGCLRYVDVCYHCSTCKDFSLCHGCWEDHNGNHEHQMTEMGFDENTSTDLEDDYKHKQDIQLLEHAYRCKYINCSWASCELMKRDIHHFQAIQSTCNCEIHNKLNTMVYFHAKRCQNTNCEIAFCAAFK